MAKRKDTKKTPDRFSVGQTVQLVNLNERGGWNRANGELGVVIGAKCSGRWTCGALDPSRPVQSETVAGERYTVRWKGGVHNFEENMLRPIYKGEKLSTWDKFEKVTGLTIRPKEPNHG